MSPEDVVAQADARREELGPVEVLEAPAAGTEGPSESEPNYRELYEELTANLEAEAEKAAEADIAAREPLLGFGGIDPYNINGEHVSANLSDLLTGKRKPTNPRGALKSS
ncbi:hypothetical protein [Streptomyces sp. NPDC058657]|uniref:hypothetical protein n=1 Tax=unclassified Streptomyces TaxID=2593676 RepID=UPI0036469083